MLCSLCGHKEDLKQFVFNINYAGKFSDGGNRQPFTTPNLHLGIPFDQGYTSVFSKVRRLTETSPYLTEP